MTPRATQALCIGFLAAQLLTLSACSDPSRYYNQARGYSIVLPEGWGIEVRSRGAWLLASRPSQKSRPVVEQITVSVRPDPQCGDLEQCFKYLWRRSKKRGTGVSKRFEEGETTIDSTEARWVIYTSVVGGWGDSKKVLKYVLLKDRRLCIISGSAPEEDFSTWRPLFERTAKSFRFE
jgi:hypothetical protein